MSSWDRDWGPREPGKPPRWSRESKKPPPEHGIKVKAVGTTWWGQRWLEALAQVLGGDSGRLLRGKTYARAGRTHDLVIDAGKVSAKVTGTRSTPYDVRLELAQLSDEIWSLAIQGMADKAQFAAELLGDQMPTAIDDVFRVAGASLFPATRADLVTSCSCPDWGDPCKHVAATHYVLGEAFDRDPFLLFELRGRSKEQVLAALRVARSGGQLGARAGAMAGSLAAGASGAATDPPGVLPASAIAAGALATGFSQATRGARAVRRVALGAIDAEGYERAPEPLPTLELTFEAPTQHGALLRQLGTPAAWRADATPEELLSPLVHAAAEAARRIALGEAAAEEAAMEVPRLAPAALRRPIEPAARRPSKKRPANAAAPKPPTPVTPPPTTKKRSSRKTASPSERTAERPGKKQPSASPRRPRSRD